MTDLAKIPVTVVTGFLGSGKTTLIRHLIEQTEGRRLAVIVNEFGDVGVAGEILKSCAIPDCPAENIVELANGCICCTVADDFIPTIEALMQLDPLPDHILIETSGLALPKPLLKAFDWPAIRSRVTVDGVIALPMPKRWRPGGSRPMSRRWTRSARRMTASTTRRRFRRCSKTSSPAPT